MNGKTRLTISPPRWWTPAVLAAAAFAWSAPAADAAGLSTTLGRVFVNNVPVGSTVSLRDVSGIVYKVTNTSRSQEQVLVSVLAPDPDPKQRELLEGYEPLPPEAKVWLSNDSFLLAPGQQGASDILIHIPKEPKHLNRKYQFNLWARNDPKGRMIAVGLKSRIMITVAPTLMTREEQRQSQRIIEDLNFHLSPFELNLGEVPIGPDVDVSGDRGKAFKIINLTERDFRVRFKRIERATSGLQTVPGVVDDAVTILPEQEELLVPSNSIGLVRFKVRLPRNAGLAGKKLRGILQAELQDYPVPVSAYGQIFLTAGPEDKESKEADQ